jgi:hypothetical protein
LKIQSHHKWLAYRETKERASQNGIEFDGIFCPLVNDILSGKGPHISNNPANIAFRKLMESRFLEHRDARAAERKTAITWEVVEEVKRRGGRFLVKDKSWWVVADQETARDKVSVMFRDMRKTYSGHHQDHADAKKRKRSDEDGEMEEDL